MTEDEWLTCGDPAAMLAHLDGRVGRRQLLLFACACARGWDNPAAERGVELGERLADGKFDERDWRAFFPPLPGYLMAQIPFHFDFGLLQQLITPRNIGDLVGQVASLRAEGQPRARRALVRQQVRALREVVGNPFHAPELPEAAGHFEGGLIGRLAEEIYDQQDYARLPILGDALEDVGADPLLVEHCHDEGPHLRGCWVIDLILGKV